MNDVTTLLTANAAGTPELFSLLYGELRSLASNQIRRAGPAPPVHTTTLVHESYLRLLESGRLQPTDRRHFLAYASTVMRSVVVDFARANLAQKRGAGARLLALDTDIAGTTCASDDEVVRVHEALEELAALDARLAKVVELKYFGGLTEAEIAEVLELATRTVQRDWEKARLVLRASLSR